MPTRAYEVPPPPPSDCPLGTTASVFATPSGLNNIPTADTTPQGTFVLQSFSTLGENRDADLGFGFKTGIDANVVRFELGAASHVLPGKSGPVTVHGKVAVPFGDGLPTLAVGAANVAFSDDQRERAGDVFGYAVLTQDFGWFRAHAGGAYVDTEALPFFGIDKTIKVKRKKAVYDGKAVRTATVESEGEGPGSGDPDAVLDTRDLFTVRADVIAQRDQSWLYSVGVLVPVTKYFVFETWANVPDNGDDASLTLKANFVVTF